MSKKVLFFVDRLKVGGIQVFLKNVFENIDFNKVSPELLVLDDGKIYDYEEKFRNLGVKVYKLDGVWIDSLLDYKAYNEKMKNFFKENHDYIAVHMNASSKNFLFLYYAKKYGINKRIVHSHNTDFVSKNVLKKSIGNILKFPTKKLATDYFACSEIAGEWLFGKEEVKKGNVVLIKNALNLKKYGFSELVRNKVRNELMVPEDALVIGHVGRFTTQKNHKFLLKVYNEIYKLKPDSLLCLAGIGELYEESVNLANSMECKESVRFLGFRNDVNELLQAYDIFLMPSLYEGFPVSGIEAQATGCSCVFSDTITKEAKILDETIYISLDCSPEEWAKKIVETFDRKTNRLGTNHLLKEKGFDIKDVTKFLENYYLRK